MKKPVKADYIKQYGVMGEMKYKLDLIKYNDEQAALKRAN